MSFQGHQAPHLWDRNSLQPFWYDVWPVTYTDHHGQLAHALQLNCILIIHLLCINDCQVFATPE